MIQEAGIGIAFHAKQILKQKTPVHLSHLPIICVAAYLGLDCELDKVQEKAELKTERNDWILSKNFIQNHQISENYSPSIEDWISAAK